MSNARATFEIGLQGNAPQFAAETADAIEGMRARVLGGEKAIKSMAESLRRLKGSSQEVKDAKAQLQAKINAERDAIGKLTAGAIQAGLPLDALSAKSKEGAGAADGLAGALGQVGGPVGVLQGKLAGFARVVGTGSLASGVFRIALVGVAAAVIAVTAASVGALVAFGRFALEGANAARTANLFREAATGSAENARNLGQQVDLLASKVSTSKEELNELAIGLARNGVQGQVLVDTFNAVGQAADAMGSEAASKLRGMVEAGRLSQRFFATRESLIGTGVSFDEVAASIARSMKVGLGDAKAALAEGRVGLGVGAAALRDAVEKKFGAINARKMLDITVQSKKFRENLKGLTSGINLDPLLKGGAAFFSLVDESTVTGAALKQMVTLFGDGFAKAFGAAAPVGAQFFKGLVIGALTFTVAILKVRKAVQGALGDRKLVGDIDVMKGALVAGQVVATTFAAVLVTVAGAFGVLAVAIAGPVAALARIIGAFQEGVTFLRSLNGVEIGQALVDGLVKGISAGGAAVKAAVVGLADSAKGALTGALKIKSPSKVFEGYGANTTEGFARGVDASAPRAQAAVDAMAPEGPSGGAGGGGGASSRASAVTLTVNITISGGGGGADRALVAPEVRAGMIQALREMALAAGLAVT